MGLPKNMNDTMGPRVEATLEFKEKLERRTGLPVHTFDERLTTVTADKTMRKQEYCLGTPEGICGYDCATLILQGYLDRQAMKRKKIKQGKYCGEDYIYTGYQ